MKFSVFQLSRKGGREKNEDRMGYCYTRDASLFVLADGMGGHPAGEVAAQLAVQTLSYFFRRDARPVLADVDVFFESAFMAAHHQILRYAQKHALKDTPRTTLVAAVVQGGLAQWAHCGDSRLYFLRDNRLVERTRDHSYLEQYRDAPVPPNKPVPTNRNVLYTCLGSPVKPVFDVSAVMPLQQGDKVLLCSDGVWGNLEEAELVQVLGSGAVPVSAPQLVERALMQGGAMCDNATLVAFEWETPSDDALTQAATLEDALDETGFSSTVQADALQDGALGDDFSDEDIERSIAEINEAIRRTAARKH